MIPPLNVTDGLDISIHFASPKGTVSMFCEATLAGLPTACTHANGLQARVHTDPKYCQYDPWPFWDGEVDVLGHDFYNPLVCTGDVTGWVNLTVACPPGFFVMVTVEFHDRYFNATSGDSISIVSDTYKPVSLCDDPNQLVVNENRSHVVRYMYLVPVQHTDCCSPSPLNSLME